MHVGINFLILLYEIGCGRLSSHTFYRGTFLSNLDYIIPNDTPIRQYYSASISIDNSGMNECNVHLSISVNLEMKNCSSSGQLPKIRSEWLTHQKEKWKVHRSSLKVMADLGCIVAHNGHSSDDMHRYVKLFLITKAIIYGATKVKTSKPRPYHTKISSTIYF